jgi:hypothetical protein
MPLARIAGGLFVLALTGVLVTDTSATGMFSLAFAIFAYLVAPGYFVMLNFNFDTLERVILGMVVSSALVPALLYSANLLGLAVSRFNVIIAILLVIVLAVVYRKTTAEKTSSTAQSRQ